MTIQINTNSTASAASFHLNRNTQALQKALNVLQAVPALCIQRMTRRTCCFYETQSSISRLSGATIMCRTVSRFSKFRTESYLPQAESLIA